MQRYWATVYNSVLAFLWWERVNHVSETPTMLAFIALKSICNQSEVIDVRGVMLKLRHQALYI